MQWGRVRITGGFALLWALLLYFDAGVLIWYWAAAAFHELGHWIVLKSFGGGVARWELTLNGISMELDIAKLRYGVEVAVALAGPFFGIIAALVCAHCAEALEWRNGYILAGANLSLALFNLLPAKSLDGGRALRHMICRYGAPRTADRVSTCLTLVTALLVAVGGVVLFRQSSYNITLFCIGITLLYETWGGMRANGVRRTKQSAPRYSLHV